jgi:hypothetical protein
LGFAIPAWMEVAFSAFFIFFVRHRSSKDRELC